MPGKPVAARGKRFSPAELEAARRVRLADVIADDLAVLFCGANPGLSSAAARAPFATPSDRWWPALYDSGFTPRRLAPHEAHEMLALGLGLTSLVRRPTVGVAELAKAEFVEGARLLRRRVLARRPRWLAVLGVTAYRAAFGRPDAAVGLQEDTIGSTRLWILPNPSGLNAHYPPRALATEFARLRVAAGLPDRSRRLEDATLCRRKGATGRQHSWHGLGGSVAPTGPVCLGPASWAGAARVGYGDMSGARPERGGCGRAGRSVIIAVPRRVRGCGVAVVRRARCW
jgi:double-stranded uracil-DNA glycosylase